MTAQRDFARLHRTKDGRQVLIYVAPEGGDYVLHQLISIEGDLADVKLHFKSSDEAENERRAFVVFDAYTDDSAEKVAEIIDEALGGGAR